MGYLINDSRGGGGSLKEWDTVACKHCQAVIKVERGARSGAWCQLCFGPVCNTAKCATRCEPFFKKIEEKQKRLALFKSLGI